MVARSAAFVRPGRPVGRRRGQQRGGRLGGLGAYVFRIAHHRVGHRRGFGEPGDFAQRPTDLLAGRVGSVVQSGRNPNGPERRVLATRHGTGAGVGFQFPPHSYQIGGAATFVLGRSAGRVDHGGHALQLGQKSSGKPESLGSDHAGAPWRAITTIRRSSPGASSTKRGGWVIATTKNDKETQAWVLRMWTEVKEKLDPVATGRGQLALLVRSCEDGYQLVALLY